jgi:phosphoglucomutase
VLLGTDTRPTGPALAQAVIAALLGSGCRVCYAGVLAAPEIMAWARSHGGAAGFIYISASHNPIGHNGIKFGLTDGGVLPGAEAASLIRAFKALTCPGDSPEPRPARLRRLMESPAAARAGEIHAGIPQAKAAAYRAYAGFTAQVVYGPHEAKLRPAIIRGLEAHPLYLVYDFNGSARTRTIDREFLASLGIRLEGINEGPGDIAHRIVPEGESLEPCRRLLEEWHRKDPRFTLGCLPDCDGDRGNLVIWDGDGARILGAQEVFALCCVAELSHLVWTGEWEGGTAGESPREREPKKNDPREGGFKEDGPGEAARRPLPGGPRAALVVNDPTSLRVDRIARAFGVELFRAEVGEANVVGLARRLREQGCLVRILGEGSGGGNITHPSAVRDPLDTLLSLIKLLAVREGPGGPGTGEGFFSIWLSRLGRPCPRDFGLSAIIDSLPPFVTTGVYEEAALLNVKTTDHGKLKNRYQAIFLRDWEARKNELRDRYGIAAWEAAAYNGMEERRPLERFGDAGRGGLKLQFLNGAGLPIAALWMRGSATEPVFRVMADAEGQDRSFERDLIFWQRRMVAEADSAESC